MTAVTYPRHMPLTQAVLDHVAIAVEDVDAAVSHWLDRGAVPVGGGVAPAFRSEQVRLGNGAKLELIGRTSGEPSFIDGYLERFGPGRVHHVTIKVGTSLAQAIDELEAAGIQTVDRNESYPHWHEAFVRPSVVGGMIVQIAWASGTDADFAERSGRPAPQPPNPAAPHLLALRMTHTDPAGVRPLWSALGATVEDREDGGFEVRWPSSPMVVRVAPGERSGPVGLVVPDLAPGERTDVAPVLLGV